LEELKVDDSVFYGFETSRKCVGDGREEREDEEGYCETHLHYVKEPFSEIIKT
jgi:hypothetical protein